MKKNIIVNFINILVSVIFMVVVFLVKLNPLSLIISFILTLTNVLLAIYSMGIKEYPEIKLGVFTGSTYLCNGVILLTQMLLMIAALSNSLWFSIIALFCVFVFIKCIMVFNKELFRFLRFHFFVTLTISFSTMVLYCILLAYRNWGFKLPTIASAAIVIVVYVLLTIKEKDVLKITAYSCLFFMALMLLAIGDYKSQGIHSAILYIISYTPVMFMLLTAGFSIDDAYRDYGVKRIRSVLVHMPIYGAGYFIGLLAIMGFPPFSLFFGRLSIIQSLITSGDYVRTGLLLVGAVVSSYFVLSKAMPVLFGSRQTPLLGIRESKYSVVILFFLAVFSLLLTVIIPGFVEGLISNARAYVLGVL